MMMMNKSFICLTTLSLLCAPVVVGQAADDEDALTVDREADSYAIAEHLYRQARQAGMDNQSRRMGLARAALLFGEFVKEFPSSPNAVKAHYMQAICLEEAGDRAGADVVLEQVAARKNGGEFAAAAAYNLATQAASRNLWERARNYFRITLQESKRADMRNDATFRLGRAYLQLGQKNEAETCFNQLSSAQGVNPVIVNASLYALAQMKTEARQYEEAYGLFRRLLERSDVDASMRGTATVQAARLATQLKKTDEAHNYYSSLEGMAGMEKYNGEVLMHKLQNLYRNRDYNAVVALVVSDRTLLDDPEKEALRSLIVGQSYMELKRYQDASKWFSAAEASKPGTAFAADAAYRRLICLKQVDNASFVKYAMAFLKSYGRPGTETATLPCVDLVRLMYADRMVLGSAQEALMQYDAINFDNLSSLSAQVRGDAMYKRAWCAAQVGNADIKAIDVLNVYMKSFPEDVHMPEAYALRGACYMRQNNVSAALADFEKVINDYPQSQSAPSCLQQAAQAASAAKDTAKMIHYYKELIKCDKRSVKPSAIAEAHYLIARALVDSNPTEAIVHFKEARNINPDQYASSVDLCLVQCYFKLKDIDNLLQALKTLEKNNSASYKALPAGVPLWCGWMCYQNKNYLEADKYLSDAVDRAPREKYTAADGNQKERPSVEPLVWKTLARSRLELRQFERGLEAAEHYVSMEEQPYRKAEGMRDKAQLLIGIHRTLEARELCEKAIEMGVDGPLKSSTYITLGDTYYAERNFAEAAKYYGRSANVVSDKEIKPLGLYKVAAALRHSSRAGEAAQYEEALRKDFPNWMPDANTAIFVKMHDKQ